MKIAQKFEKVEFGQFETYYSQDIPGRMKGKYK